MPRSCLNQRRLIAVIAAAVVLSVVLGETRVVAQNVATSALRAPAGAVLGCGSARAQLAGHRCDPVLGGGAMTRPWDRLPDGINLGTVAGLPPWLIFPPAPVPMIGGMLIRPRFLASRLSVFELALTAALLSRSLTPPPPERAGTTPGPDVGPRRPARLAGGDRSIPRPPPA